MFEKITQGYHNLKEKIAFYVQKAETELGSLSGAEKKKWVAKQIDNAIELGGLWDDVLNVDGIIIGFLIDKICHTFDIMTDGKFGLADHTEVAKAADKPIDQIVEAVKNVPLVGEVLDDVKSVQDRFKELLKEYNIDEPKAQELVAGIKEEPENPTPKPSTVDNFQKCVNLVLGHEGGYSDHPADKGGPTNLGITAGTLASAVAQGITVITDVKKLTTHDAYAIYRKMYWEKCAADKLQWFVCYLDFDACVNGGLGMAAKTLQTAMNRCFNEGLDEDGKWGPKTQAAIVKHFALGDTAYLKADMDHFGMCYIQARKEYYDRIIARSPSQSVFRNGWYNRLRKICSDCGFAVPAGL